MYFPTLAGQPSIPLSWFFKGLKTPYELRGEIQSHALPCSWLRGLGPFTPYSCRDCLPQSDRPDNIFFLHKNVQESSPEQAHSLWTFDFGDSCVWYMHTHFNQVPWGFFIRAILLLDNNKDNHLESKSSDGAKPEGLSSTPDLTLRREKTDCYTLKSSEEKHRIT